MKLPSNPDNITAHHADKAIDRARKLFVLYESRVDFNWPKEKIDDLYRPYQLARELAVQLARHTSWRVQEAEMLP